jgi:hypothetical protein
VKLRALATQVQEIKAGTEVAQKHLDSLLLAVAQWEVKRSKENAGGSSTPGISGSSDP